MNNKNCALKLIEEKFIYYSKKIVLNLTPPILLKVIDKILPKPKDDPNLLFDGDDKVFKEMVSKVNIYGEYGVGKSTVWVSNNTNANIISVDSDKQWIKKIKPKLSSKTQSHFFYIDLGKLEGWGRPKSYSKRDKFIKYVNSIWMLKKKPELVLIDGRFRVCCFLTALKYGKPGSIIVFDDYRDREYYHFVEEFVKPSYMNGRQAIFYIPTNIDQGKVDEFIQKFIFVMD